MTTILPKEKKEPVLSGKDLLLTTVAGGATAGAAAYVNKKLAPKHPAPKTPIQRKRTKLALKREHAKVPAEQKPLHPKAAASEKARSSNPKAYKKVVSGGRLAKRAAKASARAPKLGAFGSLINLPGTVRDMFSIDKEGGSSSSRLGKFIERRFGFPPGASGRSQTAAEKKAALST
jgi:hypothetical protein